MSSDTTVAANRLIAENSPYLLSHAHNPVDWYPWGEEALTKSRGEDKPIFLSIGYAACHWCHVMEKESFENFEIARLLNKYFVPIKVDREQRPDLDSIYMSFTISLTGHGGWPMSVFLTPDLKPFHAGTYYPPEDKYGRPGFKRVVEQLGTLYQTQKQSVIQWAESNTSHISELLQASVPPASLKRELIETTARQHLATVDPVYGGFGRAPKFPHPLELSLLLRCSKFTGDSAFLKAAELTLTKMAQGGIHDQLAGGFARYSVDEQWLVPHFEKMLYDNALLVTPFAEAWQITRNDRYLDVVRRTLDWVLNEMTSDDGGFYSALDADSEGIEGKFYVWSKHEITSVLGDDSEFFCKMYSVSEGGNFEGHNILNLSDAALQQLEIDLAVVVRLAQLRAKLLRHRAQRIRPQTDDKILTSWNGLMLSALCKGYQVSGDNRYLTAAKANADFILGRLFRGDSLTHSWREGKNSSGLFLEDYAFYTAGLLDLYETDFEPSDSRRAHWLSTALKLAEAAIRHFSNEQGSLFTREDNQSDLLYRPREDSDGATPSPASILILTLLKLGRLTGNAQLTNTAERFLNALSGKLAQFPASMTSAIFAFDSLVRDKVDIVLVGDSPTFSRMVELAHHAFIPNKLLVSKTGKDTQSASDQHFFEGKPVETGKTHAYVCVNSTCDLPVSTPETFQSVLDKI